MLSYFSIYFMGLALCVKSGSNIFEHQFKSQLLIQVRAVNVIPGNMTHAHCYTNTETDEYDSQ